MPGTAFHPRPRCERRGPHSPGPGAPEHPLGLGARGPHTLTRRRPQSLLSPWAGSPQSRHPPHTNTPRPGPWVCLDGQPPQHTQSCPVLPCTSPLRAPALSPPGWPDRGPGPQGQHVPASGDCPPNPGHRPLPDLGYSACCCCCSLQTPWVLTGGTILKSVPAGEAQ